MYPRLRENVWRIDTRRASAVLMTPDRTYDVPAAPALEFLKMRSYCTGHHSLDAIAQKSGLSVDDVGTLLASLEPAGIIVPPSGDGRELTAERLRDRFTKLAVLWNTEMRIMYVGNELAAGRLPGTVLIGWLIEMYHYAHDFPGALEHAALHAASEMRDVLARHAASERERERSVLATLANLGISRAEAESSTPLLSTRLIGFLMRELFALAPWSVLPVVAILRGQEFSDRQIEVFRASLSEHYGLATDALDPYFDQETAAGTERAELLAAHVHLIELTDRETLDQVTNKMHDLLHAFDLQEAEIKAYHGSLEGKYVPRQPVCFDAI